MSPDVTHFAQGGRALCGGAGATTPSSAAVTCAKCRTQLQGSAGKPDPFKANRR
jgi:hypothetical protein